VLTVAETASDVPAGSIALSFFGYAFVYAVLLLAYMVVVTQMARREAGGDNGTRPAPGPGGVQAVGA
jgi:cytochrome d ubiquinol oxidase subunit I